MTSFRRELVNAVKSRVISLINLDDMDKEHELRKEAILADESLTDDEKSEAIYLLTNIHDHNKVISSKGIRRVCENCGQECLATLFCELCVRNHLKANFSNWTSGNNEIDNLIQKCQMETFLPYGIMEWIPYDNLRNIKYLISGGCSEICTADWIDGPYNEWVSDKKQLKRHGVCQVVLKKLKNLENANKSWFEEVCNLELRISFF